jgi:hypothetical protein
MLAPLVLSVLFAAESPLDARRAALQALIVRSGDAGGCDDAHLRAAVAQASFQRLGTIGGDEVVLAAVDDPCICGAQNCPYYVVRFGRPARMLYATYGLTVSTKPAVPLPNLVITAHDSALVTDVTTAVYRGGQYVDGSSARVRGDTGAMKADDLPIHFAPGASSAVLRGRASSGWYDQYAFTAVKGQQLTVSGVHAPGQVRIAVLAFGGGQIGDITIGEPYTLPKTGRYFMQVEPDADHDVPYSLTFAIR